MATRVSPCRQLLATVVAVSPLSSTDRCGRRPPGKTILTGLPHPGVQVSARSRRVSASAQVHDRSAPISAPFRTVSSPAGAVRCRETCPAKRSRSTSRPRRRRASRSTASSPRQAGRCRTTGRSTSGPRTASPSASSRSRRGHGRADYLLFVDRKPLGVDRGEAGRARRSPASSGSRTSTRTGLPQGLGAPTRPLALRVRVDRRRDALHERLRPRAAEPPGVLVPPARDARRLARRTGAGTSTHPTLRARLRAAAAARRDATSGRRRSARSGTSKRRSRTTGRGR